MRDPAGRLDLSGPTAIRHLIGDAPMPAFLATPAARALVDDGLLVPFAIESPQRLDSPKYGFVSQPAEWTDAQLHDAAALTLQIAGRILDAGVELKDASAWNVVFEGCRPRFCDHLSFEPVSRREWWAFGQFCRHFLFTLAISRWRGMQGARLFQVYRDGVPADAARRLLGLRGLASRLLPLLWNAGNAHDAAPPAGNGGIGGAVEAGGRPLHRSVIAYARGALPAPRGSSRSQGRGWHDYTRTRAHYAVEASDFKAAQVDRWLSTIRPERVLDLGCNTGEFSLLSLRHAQEVIAIDADHDSVQRLYVEHRGETRLHVLMANLGDLSAGRGWGGVEFPGLPARLHQRCDTVLMLALTHHLHFSEGIPLAAIASLAASLSTRHLIVEVLGEDDEMVRRLALGRQRPSGAFSIERQREAYAAHFDLLDTAMIPHMPRQLLLMRRKP